MTLPVDPITLKKLFLVKRLYQHAEVLSYPSRNSVNCLMAVIGFDLAIETILKVVVSVLETKHQPEKTFDGLIQQVNDKLTKANFSQVPDESTIRRVHDLRNNAQHKAIYPSEPEVSDCRTYTRDFLRKLIFQLWSINLEDISLIDLVQHHQVKKFLEKAQTALSQNDYEETIANGNAALSYSIIQARKKHFPDPFFRLREPLGELSSRYHDIMFTESLDVETWKALNHLDKETKKRLLSIKDSIESLRKNVKGEIESLEEVQMYIILGMNYFEFLQFKKIAGRLSFYTDNNDEIKFHLYNAKENPSENEANFIFTYSLETILKVEESLNQ